MIVHWIWLATRSAVRDWVKVELVRHFGDAEGVFYAADFECMEDLTENELEALKDRDLNGELGMADSSIFLGRCDRHLYDGDPVRKLETQRRKGGKKEPPARQR